MIVFCVGLVLFGLCLCFIGKNPEKSKDSREHEVTVSQGNPSPRPTGSQVSTRQAPTDVVIGTDPSDNGRPKPSEPCGKDIDKGDSRNPISQPRSLIEGTAGVSSVVNVNTDEEKQGGANTTNSENEQQAKGESKDEYTAK